MWTPSTIPGVVDTVHFLPRLLVVTGSRPTDDAHHLERRRRPRGAVRDGLVAAGVELARNGGPDAVVLREATRMVGVVPNAAYRHFADHDELLAAVCVVSMRELAARMAAGVARVRGPHGDASAARRRLRARLALRTSSLLGTSPGCSPRRSPYLGSTVTAL